MSRQLLSKVAHYYYRERLTMAEIGERLAMSRHKVGRLLQEAVESGVVRIEIRTPSDTVVELEQELEQALALKACLVAQSDAGAPYEALKTRACEVGAGFLGDLLREGSTIGVGWGSTTFELISQLQQHHLEGAQVVQITGGNKWVNARFDCHEVTRRLAERLGVQPIVLHAPGIVDKPETRRMLLRESSIAETIRFFDQIDLAIVGIGALIPERASALVDSGYISARELEKLKAAGAVGDVFSYFVDADGRIVPSDLDNRIITIGLDQIRRIPTLLGVAAGAVKAQAMAAAVKGGFVNTLILDETLARALLELVERGVASPAAPQEQTRRSTQKPRPMGGAVRT